MNLIIYLFMFQSIPADMHFCPNVNPPCYKSKDEVMIFFFNFFQNHVD